MQNAYKPTSIKFWIDWYNKLKGLAKTKLERDLGVYVSSDLKSHGQVDHTVNKANSMLRTFTFRGVGMWKKLYTTATFGICSVRLESIFQRRYKEAGERWAACDQSCSFYQRQIIHGKAWAVGVDDTWRERYPRRFDRMVQDKKRIRSGELALRTTSRSPPKGWKRKIHTSNR